ncbi:hypothetical protein K431DRAFT_69984 [Polychaeton citri CBS 116435]|uniref:Uncharacterized protein n=1 Tax=Polychaeton citri CBS 116435 TaxID=1314669 RepID=A0A9P4Q8G4_9PEZI|nr:hypothetical protein K431DRAFT_69984 [Polychaeton citri CBS 116435]
MSYATTAANGTLASGTRSTYGVEAVATQTRRKIIVSIRNPPTLPNIRAMYPRNLESHGERALEQSQIKRITSVKIVSSDQLGE